VIVMLHGIQMWKRTDTPVKVSESMRIAVEEQLVSRSPTPGREGIYCRHPPHIVKNVSVLGLRFSEVNL